jgi:hypothetical protein
MRGFLQCLSIRYLRHRERILAAYLIWGAFHAIYLSNRAAVHLQPMSALRGLIWFSRVQGAEPLLFHSIMFAVRPLFAPISPGTCRAFRVGDGVCMCVATGCVSFLSSGMREQYACFHGLSMVHHVLTWPQECHGTLIRNVGGETTCSVVASMFAKA